MSAALAWIGVALVLASCAVPPPLARTYANPVLGDAFPDPAVLRAPAEGFFYAYATQGTVRGKTLNIQVARSMDLVNWEVLGDALPEKPRWARSKQKFWAPHVVHDASHGKFVMYYSAEPDDGEGKCLAVATSERPAGPFADAGVPLVCGEGIEHIDPMAFDDPRTGLRLLYWGSGRKPIRVQELSPDRLAFREGGRAFDLLLPQAARPYHSLIEAPWLHHRDGTYYLFYSGDRCCVPPARYAVMVARAASALGPFVESRVILEASAEWIAPGHNSVLTDDRGDDWIVYHALGAAHAAAGATEPRVMLMDRIEYRDGWPHVPGGRPSSQGLPAPRLAPH